MTQATIASPTTPIDRSYRITAVIAAVGLGVTALVDPTAASVLGFLCGVVVGMLPLVSWHLIVRLWMTPGRETRLGMILLILGVKLALLVGATVAVIRLDLGSAVNMWTLMIGMVVAIQAPLVITLMGRSETATLETT